MVITFKINNMYYYSKKINDGEIKKYLSSDNKDFIDDGDITNFLQKNVNPDAKKVKDIIAKSLEIKTLDLNETATLLNVKDEELKMLMRDAALKIKLKVYDNRIVTFAPIYVSNKCINNCAYCGFKSSNNINRKTLSMDELKKEIEVLTGKIGHKRLIAVFGEHPETDVNYIINTLKTIYDIKVKTKNGYGNIRRVNVNAAPMSIDELKQLNQAGIGTYQVFQETYHHETYKKLHPANTIKGNFLWRLYSMHRALEAGVDDVGIGALFGLYDWRFEVMGLVAHSIELEKKFGIGPHTISFPRLEPAYNSEYSTNSPYLVNDEDFLHLITVIRLSVPYTGMIITARERKELRNIAIDSGCTQTDASTKIGVGAYSQSEDEQKIEDQQFLLGDTRTLDELIRDLANKGYITSFCTAGYRSGRTGDCIMSLLKCGKEGMFCKLNAILTFQEWLDDFASFETKKIGEKLIQKEINEVKQKYPEIYTHLINKYEKIKKGSRDLFF